MSDDVFHGRQATVELGDSLPSIDGSTDLRSQFSSNVEYTGDVMDITIADPEDPIELENTFGGQFKVETPSDLVEVEVTLRFNDQKVFETLHGSSEDVDGTWSRIDGSTDPGSTPVKAFLFELDRDGETIRYFLNDAIFQSFGEVTLDAEGFAEVTGSIVCVVADRYIEQNF